MRGLFVTGTDTGAGKTVLSACLVAAMRAAGEPAGAHKPVLTGTDEPPGALAARRRAAGRGQPERAGGGRAAALRPGRLAPPGGRAGRASRSRRRPCGRGSVAPPLGTAEMLVVEGVGGLMVPLTDDYLVRDLAAELGLPLLIAARPGLGTINHTLLTLEAARAAGLDVRGRRAHAMARAPGAIERSNRETIERLGEVEVDAPACGGRARPGAAGPRRGGAAVAALVAGFEAMIQRVAKPAAANLRSGRPSLSVSPGALRPGSARAPRGRGAPPGRRARSRRSRTSQQREQRTRPGRPRRRSAGSR